MKHKKSILAAVALSVVIGAGYPPALSQQQTESKQEKPASEDGETGSRGHPSA